MSLESERALAATLLVPPKGWHWKWSPDGEAIEWEDGTTVVMREELALIIERLVPSGVPSIGPLIFLLAAGSGKLKLLFEVGGILGFWSALKAAPGVLKPLFAALMKTRPELLVGIPAKTSLASLVFAGARKLEAREASAVLALLRESLPPSAWPVGSDVARPRDILLELRDLSDGLAPLDAEKIEHALRTGIPEAPGAAEVELPLGEGVLSLLRELENDEEFQGLARLARKVMAAVILPRTLPQPDHDSPGGFADIGNRGELHRLLLSELAHDDDTLAARVAHGEALYLRREPAANPPPATLALLLDSGLRMWGVPRVFAAAVALACLAKAPPRQSARAFRASGRQAEPLILSTRAGLTAHLAALDTALNPSAALAPLVARLRTADRQLDLIVITHPLALADADFNAACAAPRDASIHAATVDRDGAFALHLRTPGGWQPMGGARLKLDALFAPRARRAASRESILRPAMLRREHCVFLLPVPQKLKATCLVRHRPEGIGDQPPSPAVRDHCVGIANDGSFWQWEDVGRRGAVRLHSTRLVGEVCDFFFDSATRCVIAIGHESRGSRLNLIRRFGGMDDWETQVTQLSAPVEKPIRVWAHGGHLFLGTERQVHVINIATGDFVTGTMLPAGMAWLNGRFAIFTEPGRVSLMAVIFDGTRVVFEPLNEGWLRANAAEVAHLIPREEGEAMWIMDREGRFLDAGTGAVQFDTFLGPLRDIRASRDGHCFLARDASGRPQFINLTAGEVFPSFPDEPRVDSVPAPHPWSLRSKFTHVAAHPSGRIWLRAKRGYWVAICLNALSHTFAMERQVQDLLPPVPVEFRDPEEITEHGCWLSLAELGGGGRVWLDSRGMLHLQVADFFLPEITIVLAESRSLPVWCSDGTIVGPDYFIGERRTRPGDAEKIDGHLRAFAASCQ